MYAWCTERAGTFCPSPHHSKPILGENVTRVDLFAPLHVHAHPRREHTHSHQADGEHGLPGDSTRLGQDGRCGFLVDSVEQCARRMVELLQDQSLAGRLAEAGREHVRENFLITRHTRDYLELACRQLAG